MVNYGLGMFHLVMGLIPPSLKSIIELVGFEGDLELGIKELTVAFESKCPRAAEAAIGLVAVKWFIQDDTEGALALLDRVSNAYPNSLVVTFFSGHFSKFTGNTPKSLEFFQSALKLASDNEFKEAVTRISCSLGTCAYLVNDWKTATTHLQNFLDVPVEETKMDYRPYSAYTLGLAYWHLDMEAGTDNHKAAITALYKEAKNWVRPDESYDAYALRKMNQFLSAGTWNPIECLVARSDALVGGQVFTKALEELEKFEEVANSTNLPTETVEEYKTIVLYLRGEARKGLKEYEEAQKLYKEAISRQATIKEETWVLPLAWFGLGEILSKQNDLVGARVQWENCKKSKGYDWEKVVDFKIFVIEQKAKLQLPQ
eukprot:TRINITY_DN4173_c0_g1_i3.p1 TRINITY_DN4173_c0_g1~~TRINITY_DN4173_c0_g1_i3.p1  ORF type:complete len:372 (-),score=86.78 TRINITY_DN4173_c0_g1_i3:52-1167(-)